jgi:hypothetical protein
MSTQPKLHEAQVGPLVVQITVDDPLAGLVSAELGGAEVSTANPAPDLKLTILGREEDIPGYTPRVFAAKKLMHFDASAFFFGYSHYFKVLVAGAFERERPVELYLVPKRPRLPQLPKTLEGLKSVVMSYQIFWAAFQLALLKHDATFLHAGIYADEKGATALTGTGGCGKTSCVFDILAKHPQSSYLSEDFGIVTAQGQAHYNPKFVSIYKSDTRQSLLRDFVQQGLPWQQKPYWYAYDLLRGNPRVKAAPSDVLGRHRICPRAELQRVVFLLRGDFPELEATAVDADALAARCCSVALREMKFVLELLHLMDANRLPDMKFPTPAEWEASQRKLYRKIFEPVDRFVVRVPVACPPDVLGQFVQGLSRA